MIVKRIKIGILSTAQVAVKTIIPTLLGLPEFFDVVAIASRDIHKARDISSQFGIINAYGSYDELLNDAALEAIYIPLPTALHYQWIRKALNRKLHVLCEKSMCCNFQEVEELNDLARINDLALLENFQFRFHRQLQYIKDALDRGVIGSLRSIKSTFGIPLFDEEHNIRYQKELGGSALLDVGACTIKMAQFFLGNDIAVTAANLYIDPKKEIDLWGRACIEQNEGPLFAQVTFGFDNHYQCDLELWGTHGKIYTNRIYTAPKAYAPDIYIETKEIKETISLEPDHHFRNILVYFYQMTLNSTERMLEYEQNILQAKLIEQLRYHAEG